MQLTFDFPLNDIIINEDNFIISSANIEAYQRIYNNCLWPDNRLLIIGSPFSGKTTLAKIFAQRTGAVFHYQEFDYNELEHNALIVENICDFKDEEQLFHLINYCHQESIQLLLTADRIPKFSVRDLTSRINTIDKVLIKQPDSIMLKKILIQHFARRQLKVNEDVIEYILVNLERSYAAINKIVETLDKLSLSQKRNITIPLVKTILVNLHEV